MNLYSPKPPTYTLDDVVRGYRLLTLKEIHEPGQVRVTHDSLNDRYNVALGGQVLYYLDTRRSHGAEYLNFYTAVPALDKEDIENMVHSHTLRVGEMVNTLFNFVDRVAIAHKAKSPEYRAAPALLEHFFELFGHINSTQTQKEIAERSVRYFNMCYYLSRHDMQFDVDQLAEMHHVHRYAPSDYSDIGPGDATEYEPEQTPEPVVEEEPSPIPEVPVEEPIELEPVIEIAEDVEVEDTEDSDEGFFNRPKPHVSPVLTNTEILNTVNALMETHPIVKILNRLSSQYGGSMPELKLFDISDNAEGLFTVESVQNPISFVELIAYEFTNTHPGSGDPRLVNDFTCRKLSEYLQVLFSDKLLDVHAEEYRSIYSMIEPSHWVRTAQINNVVQTAMCGLGRNAGNSSYQSASNEVLDSISTLVEIPYGELRSTLDNMPVDMFAIDTDASIRIDHSMSTGMYRIIEETGSSIGVSEKKVTLVVCKDASVTFMVIEVVHTESSEGEIGVQIGKTSRRDLTRSSDVSDVILTLASVTGFKLSELIPETPAV